VIAVDGKALRGFGGDRQPARHLLAALDHAHGVVLGQAGVGAKTKRNPLVHQAAGPYRDHRCGHSPPTPCTPSMPTPYLCRRRAGYLLM